MAKTHGVQLDKAVRSTEIVSLQKRMNVSPKKAYRDQLTGGRIVLLGLPTKPALVDWNKIIFNQLTIKGIYGRGMFEAGKRATCGRSFPTASPPTSFLEGLMRRSESGKIVLDWTGA